LSQAGAYNPSFELTIMWKWLGKKSEGPFDPAKLGRPWGDRQALFEFVRGLGAREMWDRWRIVDSLPDDDLDKKGVRWAAGAMDGVGVHHLGGQEADNTPAAIAQLLDKTIVQPTPEAFRVLYAYLLEHPALSYLDPLNQVIAEKTADRGKELLTLGRYMLRNAADREPMKYAINLVGICGSEEDHADLLVIGAHDEFTLYSVVATQHSGGGDEIIWEMAKRATGWGRIHCIERLDHELSDARISRWLIAEGYRNSIMTEYTAAICARRGGLLAVLSDGAIGDDVIEGGAEILRALCNGPPGEGLSGYTDSLAAARCLFELVREHPEPKTQWLLACQSIRDSIRERQDSWTEQAGWTDKVPEEFDTAFEEVRGRAVWREVIARDLQSAEDYPFNLAAEAAPLVGHDPWEDRFERLRAGHDQWYWVTETRDKERLDRALAYAEEHIDLAKIATGCGEETGLGPAFAEHRKLDWILGALRRWPGVGAKFILAGLKSPVIRNRNGAGNALLRWRAESRRELMPFVEEAHRVEVYEKTKELLARVIAGDVESEGAASV
jgi:hypothetical protein